MSERATTSPARRGSRRTAVWPGVAFDPRRNSLNLLRLVFALLVIVAHSYYTGGFGHGPTPAGNNLGGWAVIGFFVVSGYLITGSRLGNSFGSYLARRAARIYPGFWVNLIVTALVVAPLAWVFGPRGPAVAPAGGPDPASRSLADFLTSPTRPWAYVLGNATLWMRRYDVAGGPLGVPYPGVWNGSLWTLVVEFACYLMIGIGFAILWFRRHPRVAVVLAYAIALAVTVASRQVLGGIGGATGVSVVKLVPCFLAGALLYVFRDKLRFHLPGALACLAASVAIIWPLGDLGIAFAAPFLGYVIFWVSMVAPSPRVVLTEDISYGVYIYGFLAEQILAQFGIERYGLAPYIVLSMLATIPLAIASWLLVEKPVMTWTRARLRGRPKAATG